MTTKEIKIAMIIKDVTTASIAESIGVHRPHVSMIIHGKLKTPRIPAAVAKAIGMPVEEVFPITEEEKAA